MTKYGEVKPSFCHYAFNLYLNREVRGEKALFFKDTLQIKTVNEKKYEGSNIIESWTKNKKNEAEYWELNRGPRTV